MEKQCPVCEEKFNVKPSHFGRRKCCSVKCMGKYRETVYKGKDNPNYGNRGPKNPIFKGDYINKFGYVMIYEPTNPNSMKDGYVLEHRKVASEMMGRPLLPSEIVHHLNGDKTDNREENLQVMSRSEHSSIHHKLNYVIERDEASGRIVGVDKVLKGIQMIVMEGARVPHRAHPGDAGLDLFSNESITIPPKGTKMIKTGVKVFLPEGYVGDIRPRSGLSLNSPLRVVLGTLDSGYLGEVGIIADNISEEPFEVNKGDKIAQLVISPIETPVVEVVDEFNSESERGENGFGSTGK